MNKTFNKETDKTIVNGNNFLDTFSQGIDKDKLYLNNVKNLKITGTIEEHYPHEHFCFINGKLKFTYKYDSEDCKFTLEYNYSQTYYNQTEPDVSINCLNYDVNPFGLAMTDFFESECKYSDILSMIRNYEIKP